MNVGIVGCGVISRHYVLNARAFDSFRIVACADVSARAAAALAAEHELTARSVSELMADPSLDVVLNLTPPPVHADVVRQAIDAGKHVYSEKPLAITTGEAAELVALAERRAVQLGCAPDTFLSGAYQTARALLDDGSIGVPLAITATMLGGGQTTWHPNPDIFYADGAGPLLDMGPYYLTAIVALLGPVLRVAGFASTRTSERVIEIGPRVGERFAAETPTHIAALLEIEGGVTGSLVASFEAPRRSVGALVIEGSEGSLALPDPNTFDGPLRLRQGRGEWRDVPHGSHGARDARGIGLDDLVRSVSNGGGNRASGRLALHVVDVATALLTAAAEGRVLDVTTRAERPEPLVAGPASGDAARVGTA